MVKFHTVGALKKALENIPDDYGIILCVDNGVDGQAADNRRPERYVLIWYPSGKC